MKEERTTFEEKGKKQVEGKYPNTKGSQSFGKRPLKGGKGTCFNIQKKKGGKTDV